MWRARTVTILNDMYYPLTSLFAAVKRDDFKAVKKLLRICFNLRSRTALDSPLHHARSEKVAQLLISVGAPVNFRNKRGRTPLFTAAVNGHAEVVRVLLDSGGIHSREAFIQACVSGNVEVVKLLIDFSPQRLHRLSYDKKGLLINVIERGVMNCAEILTILLREARARGELMKLLSISTVDGRNVFHYAVQHHRVEGIHVIIRNLEKYHRLQRRILYKYGEEEFTWDLAEIVVSFVRGDLINQKDFNNQTPLNYAYENSCIVPVLLQGGADPLEQAVADEATKEFSAY